MPTAERLARDREKNDTARMNNNPTGQFQEDDDEEAAALLASQRYHDAMQAANYSVKREVSRMPKFILTIPADKDKEAMNPVPVQNGDYRLDIWRGFSWIVPECVVTALRDARGQEVDNKTNRAGRWIGSYSYQATPYSGELALGTCVDENGRAIDPNAMAD